MVKNIGIIRALLERGTYLDKDWYLAFSRRESAGYVLHFVASDVDYVEVYYNFTSQKVTAREYHSGGDLLWRWGSVGSLAEMVEVLKLVSDSRKIARLKEQAHSNLVKKGLLPNREPDSGYYARCAKSAHRKLIRTMDVRRKRFGKDAASIVEKLLAGIPLARETRPEVLLLDGIVSSTDRAHSALLNRMYDLTPPARHCRMVTLGYDDEY
jgi:hypothetical protein